MGHNLTAIELFERLGVAKSSQNALKQDMLNYLSLQSASGGNLTAISDQDLAAMTQEYLRSGRLSKHCDRSSSHRPPAANPNEGLTHQWLLQLAKTWLSEQQEKESQEDPSWSASLSTTRPESAKKRKRPTNASTHAKSSNGNQNKKSLQRPKTLTSKGRSAPKPLPVIFPTGKDKPDTHQSRSPTAGFDSGTLQDIQFRNPHEVEDADEDEDEDEEFDKIFPPASQLIADRSGLTQRLTTGLEVEPATPSASPKGKAPVRDPPGPINTKTLLPDTSSLHVSWDERAAPITISENSTPTAVPERDEEFLRPTEPSEQDIRPSRSFKSLLDLEQSETVGASTTPPASWFPSLNSPAISQHQSTHTALGVSTPPPTGRHLKFMNLINIPSLHNKPKDTTKGPDSYDERLVDFLYQLVEYIGKCEDQSIKIASQATSSERERQTHQIRAVVCANLRMDVRSRVEAFLNEGNGVEGKGQITSYCLWSLGVV